MFTALTVSSGRIYLEKMGDSMESAQASRARFSELMSAVNPLTKTAEPSVAVAMSVLIVEGFCIRDDPAKMSRLTEINTQLEELLVQAKTGSEQERARVAQEKLARAAARYRAYTLGKEVVAEVEIVGSVVERLKARAPVVADLYTPSSLDAAEVVDRLEFDTIEPMTALERLKGAQKTLENLSSILNTVIQSETVAAANDVNAKLRQLLDENTESKLWKSIYSDMVQEANRTADLARAFGWQRLDLHDAYYAACSDAEQVVGSVAASRLPLKEASIKMRDVVVRLRAILRRSGYYSHSAPKEAYESAVGERARYASAEQTDPGAARAEHTTRSEERNSSTDQSMTPSEFDPYGVLGISPRATTQEILDAYRSMTREYHPDLFASDEHSWVREAASTKMEQVNEAWSVLGTPETRAEFDRLQACRERY